MDWGGKEDWNVEDEEDWMNNRLVLKNHEKSEKMTE